MDHSYFAPLTTCLENDDVETLRQLIQHGAFDVNTSSDTKTRTTILAQTVICEKRKCFDYLVSVPGVDVNCQDCEGTTPLMVAAGEGFSDYVDKLLSEGADVSLRDRTGSTALHYVRSANLVPTLVGHGADVDAVNKFGETPLHLLLNEDGDFEVANMLLFYGTDTSIMDQMGWNVLTCAIRLTGHEVTNMVALYSHDHIKEPMLAINFMELMKFPGYEELFYQLLNTCSELLPCESRSTIGEYFLGSLFVYNPYMLDALFERFHQDFYDLFRDSMIYFKTDPLVWMIFRQSSQTDTSTCASILKCLDKHNFLELYIRLNGDNRIVCKNTFVWDEDLEPVSEIILILLSRGFVLTPEFLCLLYSKVGDCELFRKLLHFACPFTLSVMWPLVRMKSTMCMLICEPSLTLDICLRSPERYRIDENNILQLFEFFASRKLQDYCYANHANNANIMARLNRLPSVPTLLQLARDCTREHIMKVWGFKSSSMFYSLMNHLPIQSDYIDILSYKRKLYNFDLDFL